MERAEARRSGGARSPTRGSTGRFEVNAGQQVHTGIVGHTQLRCYSGQRGEEGEGAEYGKRVGEA